MIRSLAAGLCLGTLLLAPVASHAQTKPQPKAEVIHWWTSAGESAAVKVFADQFTKAGGIWVDMAIAGGVNARTAAINAIVGGNPPTAMQFNTGKQFDDLVENDFLVNMDSLAKSEKWASIMPAAILAAVTRDGHAYAVPINIHGQNWLFTSNAALAKAGATAPTNWDDLFPALDKLKAAGLIPLAFSGQKNWERGLFNSVLAGMGGGEMFTVFWGKRDIATIKSPQFRTVVDTYRRLHNYVDAGAAARNWNDATGLLIQGKAGMQFMGDWAKGEFSAAGQTPDKEYGCTVLGAKSVSYLMGGDVFAFPKQKDPTKTATQMMLAGLLLDPATQIAFAQKKGSIPVRLDLDTSSLDACARKASGWLADPKTQVPANELLSPPALTGAVEDLISQFWNDPSMTADTFIARLASTMAQPF